MAIAVLCRGLAKGLAETPAQMGVLMEPALEIRDNAQMDGEHI